MEILENVEKWGFFGQTEGDEGKPFHLALMPYVME
jgi:hypothetical protein